MQDTELRINLDEEALRNATAYLGTGSPSETVSTALREIFEWGGRLQAFHELLDIDQEAAFEALLGRDKDHE